MGPAMVLVALCGLVGRAGAAPQADQSAPTPPGYSRPAYNHLGLGADSLDPAHPIGPSPAKLEHMREEERRKRLMSDTARLVELTNELKSEIEKSSKDELSLDVVKKAAEIEKLAHDVKERMKS